MPYRLRAPLSANPVIQLTAFRRKSIALGVRGAPSAILDATALLKEFLHRVVFLYIRLTSYIPEAMTIKAPADIPHEIIVEAGYAMAEQATESGEPSISFRILCPLRP